MYRLSDIFYILLFNVLEVFLLPLSLFRRLVGPKPAWPPQRVLVIHTEGIGDLLMATPLIAAIRRQWPEAEIVLAVQPQPGKRSLLEGTGCINRTVELPDSDGLRSIRRRRFWTELAESRFDLAVLCFPFNRRWKLAFLWILLKLRCAGAALRFRASDFLNWSRWIRFYRPAPRHAHRVEINLAIADRLQIDRPEEPHLLVGVTDDDRAFADSFLERHDLAGTFPLVGIHPGSLATSSYKRWPAEKHVELVRRLHETFDCRFVLFEGPDDAEAVEELAAGLGEVPCTILRGATLGRVAAVVGRCDLMINTDAALGHVAAAVDTPTVTIFGPGDPARVRPWGRTVRVIRREDLCAPCKQLWRPMRCDYGFRCVREISVETVFRAAGEILGALERPATTGDR